MIQIYIAEHPTEAHFVKGLLETEEINCCVRGENLFSARGEIPITAETAPSVWIYDKSRLEEAETVIKDYLRAKKQETADGESWTCPSCGEVHESQFTSCWNCGCSK